jgi:hypothetical protein
MRFTDEKSAVIKYEPPRVLRMDLTNEPYDCTAGSYAAFCTIGAYFILQSCEEKRRGKKDFPRGY